MNFEGSTPPFLENHPGRPGCNFTYVQTTKCVPLIEPARLPGSYEEALKTNVICPVDVVAGVEILGFLSSLRIQ